MGSLLVAGIFMFAACDKDDNEPVDPNKPENVDPNAPVDDPVGTVVMRMRNDNETKLGYMIVSPENNFHCISGMIASLGKVTGLGNINDIPLTGWSDDVAVIIGNGYVYYDGNQYYRIFASQWLYEAGTNNAIIGVELKFQTPFKGVDEELQLESTTLSFSDAGGTDQIRFKNTPVIPFTIEMEKDCDWCNVSRWSSSEKSERFLYDGVQVVVSPNIQMEETRTKVIIKTLYGKRTMFEVVRSGQTPTVYFPNGETEDTQKIGANGGSRSINLTTNIEEEDFKAVADVDWIRLETVNQAPSRDMRNRVVRFTVLPNNTAAKRTGKVSFSSVKGEKTSVLSIEQEPGQITSEQNVEVSANTLSVNAVFSTNVTGDINITSSETWCKPAAEKISIQLGNSETLRRFTIGLTLEPNNNDKPRKAVLTASSSTGNLKATMEIVQNGPDFENVPRITYFDRKRSSLNIELPINNMKAVSSESWCQTIITDNYLRIIVDETTEDRTATVSLEGTSVKIQIDQSKYAVGDPYEEKGVKGTVYVMKGAERYVRSEILGMAAYTISEFYSIGATSRTNGLANMDRVRSLGSWQTYYPAFALCDELNKDGVTGWYLPAIDQMAGTSLDFDAWSSTENGDKLAFYYNRTGISWTAKDVNKYVFAIHPFVK